MYKAMSELGIPLKLIRLVKATKTGTTSQIHVQATLLEPLEIHNGLRQGNALACLLFNVALEKAIRDSGIQIGWYIFKKSVKLLAYADYIVLLGRKRSRLEEAFLDLERAAGRIGLKINQDKTKYMVICARMPDPSELIMDR
jgi:sorting nexin-29